MNEEARTGKPRVKEEATHAGLRILRESKEQPKGKRGYDLIRAVQQELQNQGMKAHYNTIRPTLDLWVNLDILMVKEPGEDGNPGFADKRRGGLKSRYSVRSDALRMLENRLDGARNDLSSDEQRDLLHYPGMEWDPQTLEVKAWAIGEWARKQKGKHKSGLTLATSVYYALHDQLERES